MTDTTGNIVGLIPVALGVGLVNMAAQGAYGGGGRRASRKKKKSKRMGLY